MGRTPNILDLMHELKKRKAKIILISATYEEQLSPLANYHLYMCSYESFHEKISSFSSRISLQYLLDCIYACFFNRDYEKHLNHKINHYID